MYNVRPRFASRRLAPLVARLRNAVGLAAIALAVLLAPSPATAAEGFTNCNGTTAVVSTVNPNQVVCWEWSAAAETSSVFRFGQAGRICFPTPGGSTLNIRHCAPGQALPCPILNPAPITGGTADVCQAVPGGRTYLEGLSSPTGTAVVEIRGETFENASQSLNGTDFIDSGILRFDPYADVVVGTGGSTTARDNAARLEVRSGGSPEMKASGLAFQRLGFSETTFPTGLLACSEDNTKPCTVVTQAADCTGTCTETVRACVSYDPVGDPSPLANPANMGQTGGYTPCDGSTPGQCDSRSFCGGIDPILGMASYNMSGVANGPLGDTRFPGFKYQYEGSFWQNSENLIERNLDVQFPATLGGGARRYFAHHVITHAPFTGVLSGESLLNIAFDTVYDALGFTRQGRAYVWRNEASGALTANLTVNTGELPAARRTDAVGIRLRDERGSIPVGVTQWGVELAGEIPTSSVDAGNYHAVRLRSTYSGDVTGRDLDILGGLYWDLEYSPSGGGGSPDGLRVFYGQWGELHLTGGSAGNRNLANGYFFRSPTLTKSGTLNVNNWSEYRYEDRGDVGNLSSYLFEIVAQTGGSTGRGGAQWWAGGGAFDGHPIYGTTHVFESAAADNLCVASATNLSDNSDDCENGREVVSIDSDTNLLIQYLGNGANAATDTGNEVCAAVGLVCAQTFDFSSTTVSCATTHANWFQAGCHE